jgi:monoamine oxidase
MESLQAAAASVAAGDAPRSTRRDFLKRAGAAGAGLTALGRLTPAARATSQPSIAVVGAGLAGLTCAYRLGRAGYRADVYEASSRIGGRCWSGRAGDPANPFRPFVIEHGGELIDQGHGEIRNLAQELGLDLDNLLSAEANGTEILGWFDDRPYSFAEMTDDMKSIWQQLHKDVSAASYPTTWDNFTQRGRELDRMSIVDWIERYVPGGIASRLGQLLDVAYNIEYGGESDVQSALNMLYLLAYSGQGQLRIFGPSNEKYHVRGGNDQIPERMAPRIPGDIRTGHELVAIRRTPAGRYELTFAVGSGTTVVAVDRVVLALPFSIVRRSVDYDGAGFEPRKVTAIEEQGMGTNSKLLVGFSRRHWVGLGSNGETFSDTGYQNTWEVTRAQPGVEGVLVDYTGGDYGATFGSGTPASRTKTFLKQIEPVLPGISHYWNGKASIDYWTGYEWTRGSYSFWKVGQYTTFAGIEGTQQGGCHFCGEHTSIDFQGYLNGAVETGERAAAEVIADLG